MEASETIGRADVVVEGGRRTDGIAEALLHPPHEPADANQIPVVATIRLASEIHRFDGIDYLVGVTAAFVSLRLEGCRIAGLSGPAGPWGAPHLPVRTVGYDVLGPMDENGCLSGSPLGGAPLAVAAVTDRATLRWTVRVLAAPDDVHIAPADGDALPPDRRDAILAKVVLLHCLPTDAEGRLVLATASLRGCDTPPRRRLDGLGGARRLARTSIIRNDSKEP